MHRTIVVSHALVLVLSIGTATCAERIKTGPWDLDQLRGAPKVAWNEAEGCIRSLYYEGLPYQGRSTRVFAFLGLPPEATAENPVPAMVLVHGGGGTAFSEWVQLWVDRGYAALAMDLAGCEADRRRMADGGPDQTHTQKFDDLAGGVTNAWTYHAVANVIRGVSLVKALPEVDTQRVGITGISWGGYLTCLVAGLDQRLKVAVPVYGCGFLQENSCWLEDFSRLGPELAQQWTRELDPRQYLAQAEMPILFINGTNDFAYPLDSYQKTYRLVKQPRRLCVTVRMPHGHQAGWAPQEIGLFVDSILRDGKPLPRVLDAARVNEQVKVEFESILPLDRAELHFTTDQGPWRERSWTTVPASLQSDQVLVKLPDERPIVYFLTLVDQRGAVVSTEHEVVE
jgi:dienelactone hydrolase